MRTRWLVIPCAFGLGWLMVDPALGSGGKAGHCQGAAEAGILPGLRRDRHRGPPPVQRHHLDGGHPDRADSRRRAERGLDRHQRRHQGDGGADSRGRPSDAPRRGRQDRRPRPAPDRHSRPGLRSHRWRLRERPPPDERPPDERPHRRRSDGPQLRRSRGQHPEDRGPPRAGLGPLWVGRRRRRDRHHHVHAA